MIFSVDWLRVLKVFVRMCWEKKTFPHSLSDMTLLKKEI